MKILLLNIDRSRMTLADFYISSFGQLAVKSYKLNLFYERVKSGVGFGTRPGKEYRFTKERFLAQLQSIVWRWKRESKARIIRGIRQMRPDIIMAIGNIELEPDIFKEIKAINRTCATFCYFTDPLLVNNALIRESLSLYDCVFTFSRFQVPLLYWFGARNVLYLPFAFDPRIHRPLSLKDREREFYGSDVTYLGTWQPYLESWIKELSPYDLKIWGDQWYLLRDNFQLRACWQGPGAGLYDEMPKVISSSKIIFNLIRFHNGNSHSMKTFEIPACGGFMLTNRTDEQLEFFPEDKGAVYFSSREELKEKIRYYLNNDAVRIQIAKAGYQLARPHTYDERARAILNLYQKIKSAY